MLDDNARCVSVIKRDETMWDFSFPALPHLLMAQRNQLRTQHEVGELAQRRDRDLLSLRDLLRRLRVNNYVCLSARLCELSNNSLA